MQSGERDWAIEKRRTCIEDAVERFAFELGVHGYCCAGMESEGLVRPDGSGPKQEEGHPADGVQTVPFELHSDSLSSSQDRPTLSLSDFDLQ